ncbi:tyrosine-protein phosphatase [Streptomyces sp. NPDC050636]|uniref:tyrosine-protein phosphatase n=1 Tax=Streptomyces sp. NPDC050636 TaxID=3154510 RepID=UPI00343D65BA
MNSHSTAAVLTARRIAVSFMAAVSAVGVTAPLASATGTGRHTPQAPLAAHGIPFADATVTQQKDGSFTVSWKAPGVVSVTVYAGDRAVAHGGPEDSVTVRGLPATDRRWFRLVPDQGDPLSLADRSLHLEGVADFRDAGGYRTADGRWVKMGVLYRTSDLHALTDADLAKLQRLGIRTDFDEWLVSKPSAIDAYRSLFSLAADPGSYALAYHCEGGKDRTGWATAALLTALGVDRDTVTRDYLATNDHAATSNAATLAKQTPEMAARLKPMLDARAEYLNASFDEVKARFGTFDAYLRDGLGLSEQDLERLREALLTD